jgi:hypothetical protein
VRNSLYFDLGLDRRPDVALASYDETIAEPERAMRALCTFLGVRYRAALVEGIEPRHRGAPGIDIEARIRERCEALEAALDAAMARRAIHPDG